MPADFNRIKAHYESLEADREANMKQMREIARFAGIRADSSDFNSSPAAGRNPQGDLDEDVYDPTAAIAVNQSGDFLSGVLWHPDAVDLVPSRYILNKVSSDEVDEFYRFVTKQLLFHINHSQSGFMTAIRPYSYDQAGFGTSGISAFANPAFMDGGEDNAILFNNFGVDRLSIAEGKNGRVETVFITYWWTATRIVQELGIDDDGDVTDRSLGRLPNAVRQRFNKKDDTKLFKVVFGAFPRDNFKPGLRGRRGKKYSGVWFMPDERSGIIEELDFAQFPVPVARAVRIRGEKYGRSPGTILLSAIRGVNFMLGSAFDVVDKLHMPPLGIFGSAISGDNVLDTSANSLTVFNQEGLGGQNPVFNIADVGDPSPILNFLVPFLNEKITTGFKLDSVLDLGTDRDVTATESLQRFSIRGKTMSGILVQQKIEMIEPIVHRCVEILQRTGELGINSKLGADALRMAELRGNMEVPAVVQELMDAGLPWYEIRFNTDMEKLLRTEKVDGLLELLNVVGAVSNIKPETTQMLDEYNAVDEFKDNRTHNSRAIKSRDDYEAILQAAQQAQQQAQQLQQLQDAAEVSRTEGFAEQARSKARQTDRG